MYSFRWQWIVLVIWFEASLNERFIQPRLLLIYVSRFIENDVDHLAHEFGNDVPQKGI